MQLLKIRDPKVEIKFLQCYLQVENVKLGEMKLYQKNDINYIGNEKLLSDIRDQYQKFKAATNVNMEQFFNRQIIICNRSRENDYIVLNVREITRRPLFLVKSKHGALFWGYELKDFRAQKPVKMSAELIFGLYGVPGTLDMQNIPDFVNLYELLEIQDVVHPCRTMNTPGESNEPNPISIAYDETDTFWVTHQDLVKTVFTCEKFPGKCMYHTVDKPNFNRHMASCTDQPILTSRQVNIHYGPYYMGFNFDFLFDKLFTFYLSEHTEQPKIVYMLQLNTVWSLKSSKTTARKIS